MIFFVLLFIFYIASSQYCGRFINDCTGISSLGSRTLYTVGVQDYAVTSVSQSVRYYTSGTCDSDPSLVITTVYDVTKNSTDTDYTADYIYHRARVTDYLILTTDVSLMSTLGISCIPALENNVEVSLRRTTCTSSTGIIQGSSFIGTNSTFYIRYPSANSLQISNIYPLITVTTYNKIDTTGCVGCRAESIWPATEMGSQARGFCEDYLQGYLYRTCVLGESGNGVWGSGVASECFSVEPNPTIANGEAYYRGILEVRMDPGKFDAAQHYFINEQLLTYVRACDLPASALVMEQVVNVNTEQTAADSSKPMEIHFRVTGERGLVRDVQSSITTAINRGTLHRRLIVENSAWYDASIKLGDNSELVMNNDLLTVVIICLVVIVILIVIIILLTIALRKTRKNVKIASVESISSGESYSEEYSDYSYTDSTDYV